MLNKEIYQIGLKKPLFVTIIQAETKSSLETESSDFLFTILDDIFSSI